MESTQRSIAWSDSVPFRELTSAPRSLECTGLELAETLHRAGAATGTHTHRRPRLCLVLAGCFEETIGGGSRHRGSGALILYPSEVAHDDRFSERGARCLNIQLPTAGPFPDATDGSDVLQCGVRAVEAAYAVYDGFRAGAPPGVLSRRTRALVSVVSGRSNGSEDPYGDPLARARDLVEREARSGITLSVVAREVEMDRYALARRFRTRYGCSVGEYRHRVLLRRAREELLSSDDSLSSVAYDTGFSDQSHFTRIFKRYTGLTPGRYRRLDA